MSGCVPNWAQKLARAMLGEGRVLNESRAMKSYSDRSGVYYGSARTPRGLALVLGTGEIASAIAAVMHSRGWSVILSHDADTAVLRRSHAYYDALFGDAVTLDGIAARQGSSRVEIERILAAGDSVVVTPLDLMDLIVLGPFDLLIDARMQDGAPKPELRWLAGLSFGVGAGWFGGVNCDMSLRLPLAEAEPQAITTAPQSGYWYTAIEPGMRVYRHLDIGKAGGATVRAPCDGVVQGILRDGLRVRAGMPLIEIHPRLRKALAGTINPCGRDIGRQIAAAASSMIRGMDGVLSTVAG